jgi:uncharacterized protein
MTQPRTTASRDFQVFVKPAGPVCNLNCSYCYYLDKQQLYPAGERFRMSDDLLELYISQHIAACPDPIIRFSWHGGEPTILGLDYFRRIVELQRKHTPAGRQVANAIQTNGTILNEQWCRFLADNSFAVGLSLDGPRQIHDRHRLTPDRRPTFNRTMHGLKLLQQHGVAYDILCVVNSRSVRHPLELYDFFKDFAVPYITFLPLVQHDPAAERRVSARSIPADHWGQFLCAIFDRWLAADIGTIKIQIFEEAARTAFDQEHSLCIFRPVCGDIPVIEHNGDFFCCDHYVDGDHLLGNIHNTPLIDLLESPAQRKFGQDKLETLPQYCLQCEVRGMCNGGCPKNRFIAAPDGEPGLNYLCAGYKRFFSHCLPWVQAVRTQWQNRQPTQQATPVPIQPDRTPGRNEPCPCGSGRKFKNCCMSR